MAPDEMTITVIQGRGTAYYTPLEQYGAMTVTPPPRTDLYAFAATLYHLMTNTPPARSEIPLPGTWRPPSAARDQPCDSCARRAGLAVALALHPDERLRTPLPFVMRSSLARWHP